jgi:hypothetical protein
VTKAAPPHDDLRAVMDAVRIESPTAYAVGGVRRELRAAAEDESQEAMLLSTLEADVYGSLYVRPTRTGAVHASISVQREFLNQLSGANTGAGTWEPGWRIVSALEDGLVEVRKDEVSFWVPPHELRTQTKRIKRGEFCRVHVGKEMRQLVPGFYFAIGDGDAANDDRTDPLVRVYWNLTADAAIPYMAAATRVFNTARVPFRTKVLADPSSYARADGGVLYVERRHFTRARALVARIREDVRDGLRDEVPLFAKSLAPGVGLAEDPGDGSSFGQSRSSLVARALWHCHVNGIDDIEERAAGLADEFRRAGLDPARPWLSGRGRSDEAYAIDEQPHRAAAAT